MRTAFRASCAICAVVLAAVAFDIAPCSAGAPPVGPQMPCSVVVATFNQERKQTIAEIADTGRDLLEQLDAVHTRSGEPGIIAKLSDRGISGLIAMAIEECRSHPKERFGDAIGIAYLGNRELAKTLGILK